MSYFFVEISIFSIEFLYLGFSNAVLVVLRLLFPFLKQIPKIRKIRRKIFIKIKIMSFLFKNAPLLFYSPISKHYHNKSKNQRNENRKYQQTKSQSYNLTGRKLFCTRNFRKRQILQIFVFDFQKLF